MTLSSMPSAKAELLIRRPVSEVFEAFVDPAITSKFGSLRAAEDWNLQHKSDGIGRCTIFL
jgi:uncharacterized protein YndB with AHSA1/START domain